MKKVNKSLMIVITVFIIIPMLLLIWIFNGSSTHIKTIYGDSFTVIEDPLISGTVLNDDNSGYSQSLSSFYGKSCIKNVCDSEYFRCYRINESEDNLFICKIKNQDRFFSVNMNYKDEIIYNLKEFKEWYISDFLCDHHYMEIILPYLDEVYHDEITAVAQKLVNRDFEGLDKYGLTEEMINDKESLDEKISIMEEYLKANKEQTGTSSTVQ